MDSLAQLERTGSFVSILGHRYRMSSVATCTGDLGEWFKPAVLKTADPQGSVSSNLTVSATHMYIGLLEDEAHLAQHVREILENAGHTVTTFPDGAAMVKAIGRDTFDLFVLDWRVPKMSGIEVLKHIREVKKMTEPVLFLTSRSDEQDITEALNAGADDYCTKPVRAGEFSARVNALLRRVYPENTKHDTTRLLLNYSFNTMSNEVTYDHQTHNLTEKEFKLALLLFENAERAVSRERIVQEIWGHQGDDISRSVDVHISWLRKKLHLAGTSQHLRLKPIYGFGYRLMAVKDNDDV
jgi:two-component system response regulator RegX3